MARASSREGEADPTLGEAWCLGGGWGGGHRARLLSSETVQSLSSLTQTSAGLAWRGLTTACSSCFLVAGFGFDA